MKSFKATPFALSLLLTMKAALVRIFAPLFSKEFAQALLLVVAVTAIFGPAPAYAQFADVAEMFIKMISLLKFGLYAATLIYFVKEVLFKIGEPGIGDRIVNTIMLGGISFGVEQILGLIPQG